MEISESDLTFALTHDTVEAAGHERYSMVPRDLLQSVRKRSARRGSNDKEVDDLRKPIELDVAQQELDKVSLNDEKFMARREELNAQKEEEEKEMEQQLGNEVIYRDNFYNREVLNIAHDYVDGLRKQNLAQAR